MSRWNVRGLKDVAAFFAVAFDTVKRDWRAAGMPGKPGSWDLSAIARWRIEKGDRRRSEPNPPPSPAAPATAGDTAEAVPTNRDAWNDPEFTNQFEQWRGRKLKNDALSGQIVLRADVARDAAELLSALRDGLENFPEKLAGELPFAQRSALRQRLEHLVEIELNRLADEIEHRFGACEPADASNEPKTDRGGAGEPAAPAPAAAAAVAGKVRRHPRGKTV